MPSSENSGAGSVGGVSASGSSVGPSMRIGLPLTVKESTVSLPSKRGLSGAVEPKTRSFPPSLPSTKMDRPIMPGSSRSGRRVRSKSRSSGFPGS